MSHSWEENSACSTVDPELFYPEPGRRDMADEARQVCGNCPVLASCLAHALGEDGCAPERHGIWGGTSEDQRTNIYWRRARAAEAAS